MGGVYGDKPSTLARFKENYVTLPDNIKARLVLENDEVSVGDGQTTPRTANGRSATT
jgi:UV DNA damage endonuclease